MFLLNRWSCWCLLVLLIGMMMISSSLSSSSSDNLNDDDSDGGWSKLEISPNVIGSVPYSNFRINVYEHAANNESSNLKKFFYAPISFLDHASAVSYLNNVTKQAEMRFRIELWNDAIQKDVTSWIKREIDSRIKDSSIQVIPFEKVIIAASSDAAQQQQPEMMYQLPRDWTPYQLQKDVRFKLICNTLADCQQLEEQMKWNADQFSDLRLLFSVSNQKTKTRSTVIRVENILAGQMASTLLQRLPDAESAFLTAKDEKRLLTESTTNILIDTMVDSDDVISPNSEAQIYQLLRNNLLAPSRTIIKEQSDKMWESVFWDDDNYRPDKTTKTWNEIYSKLDKEKQNRLVETFEKRAQLGIGWKKFLGIDVDFVNSSGHSSESIEKIFEESKETVVWEGTKFAPKPLSLSRMNLAKLRDTQTFKDRTIRVRYSKAVLAVAVNIAQHTDFASSNRLVELQHLIDGNIYIQNKPQNRNH